MLIVLQSSNVYWSINFVHKNYINPPHRHGHGAGCPQLHGGTGGAGGSVHGHGVGGVGTTGVHVISQRQHGRGCGLGRGRQHTIVSQQQSPQIRSLINPSMGILLKCILWFPPNSWYALM